MAIYHPPETIDEILEMDKLEYMENQNPIRDDERKDPHRFIKIELLGIIAAYQDPVHSNRIFRDFEEMNGYPLDPTQYGFKSFTSMMRTFCDKFICHTDGLKTLYSAKTTERSGHLQELIKNQVTIEEKRRRDMRRSRSYSRPRKSSYGAGFFYSQNFVPVQTDERTQEERIAANMASFGRSLAGELSSGEGLDWGGRRNRMYDEASDESDDEGGLILRSRSAPPRKPIETVERTSNVFDDPKSKNLEDCTNPFRVQNNVRIRDIVMEDGESDDAGRKGLALIEVAAKFKKQFRLPLGGVPNLPVERLLQKMEVVNTVEWVVEKMGDGNVYVIVPVETIKRAKEVGPGTRSDTLAAPAEKPKTTGVSPAAKRMFGFALKQAVNTNGRMKDTRENVLKERQNEDPEMYDGVIECDSDGDPRMSFIPVNRDKEIEKEEVEVVENPPLPSEKECVYDRDAMVAYDDKAGFDVRVKALAYAMRILRSQPTTNPCRPSPSSSNSSVVSNRGKVLPPNVFTPRSSPPKPSSNMSFGGSSFTSTPSFGTFRSAPPPASEKEDDDSSVIIQPSQSSLASKLPQSSFSFSKPTPPAPTAFTSLSGPAPSFGTRNQSVPPFASAATRPVAPSFGANAPVVPPVAAFGGLKVSSPAAVVSAPKKMVEVIESIYNEEKTKNKATDLLAETIQLIGMLRSGAVVFMRQIEGKPVEEVIAGNPDFFDIDEKDERIHLLHNSVDPLLLMKDGRMLGEMAEEETKKKKEVMKVEEPPKEVTKPVAPTFGGLPARQIPTFGATRATEANGKPLPTFGGVSRPVKMDDPPMERPASSVSITTDGNGLTKPRPTFGAPISGNQEEGRKVVPFPIEPVERAPSAISNASSIEPPKPQPGMPSFGTRSLHVPERPDSALSNRSVEPEKVREMPPFGGVSRPVEIVSPPSPSPAPIERPPSVMSDITTSSDSTVESTQGSKYRTAESDFSGRKTESVVSSSVHSSQLSLEGDDEEDEELAEERVETSTGPYSFPNHADIRRLSRKVSLAFDSIRQGKINLACILTSMEPNRLVMALKDNDAMAKTHLIMQELRPAYVDKTPLGADNVRLGQFAVAINGDVIVRVVVLRFVEGQTDSFLCACLDINAIIDVAGHNLYELLDRFGVHALRSSTFIARIHGLRDLGERGHRSMKLIVKGEDDDSFKRPQPFVFHGKDVVTGDLMVDVAINVAGQTVWMGESLHTFIGGKSYRDENVMNPGIEHAIKYALDHDVYEYRGEKISVQKEEKKVEQKEEEKKVEDVESDSDTPNEADLHTIRCDSAENMLPPVPASIETKEKEEGELDSSVDESTASEKTTVDRHAAGDYVRDEKDELPDEFIVAAPIATKPIIDVESMTSLIRLFNAKGEHVAADVMKAMCRALILSANNTLSSLGERGALIANAEALEAIDMA